MMKVPNETLVDLDKIDIAKAATPPSVDNIFAKGACLLDDSNGITNLTRITFLNPGVSYEKRVGDFQSLYTRVFISASGFASYSSSFGFKSRFYFDPALAIQDRYYYNAEIRKKKGKRTEMNSLNYISPLFETFWSKGSISSSYYAENNRRLINKVGLAWGLQRNFEKRFSLDLNLGLGYLFTRSTLPQNDMQVITKNTSQFTIFSTVSLGFWLNQRK